MSRKARSGSLGELLPLAAVEPDGLLVTTTGQYVRLIACERVPNTITADEGRLQMLERAFRELCRAIPDRRSLVFYAQTDPIPIDDALAEDRARVGVACEQDEAAGHGELAATRRRFLAGLTQTVFGAAGSKQPAVTARWWVAVPYQPAAPETPRDQFRHAAMRARGKTSWGAHHDAAVGSLQLTGQIQAALASAGIETYLLDGVQTLALLWERIHPAAAEHPDLDLLADAVSVAVATSTDAAAEQRHRVLRALCDGAAGDRRRGEPRIPAPFRRDARGGPASRDPAAADQPVVACAPAVLPAADHGCRAHHGRAPRRRAGPPAAAVEAAARSRALQAAARSARRLRRGRRLGGGPGRRRRARLRARGDCLQRRDLLRDPRPARRRARVPAPRRRHRA